MKNLLKLFLIAFPLLIMTSCGSDDDSSSDTLTLEAYLAANSDYSTLLQALNQTGLMSTLNAGSNLTIFAPNNAAFTAFLVDNNYTSLSQVPNDVLTQVLKNHVLVTRNTTESFTTGYYETLATSPAASNNVDMYVKVDGVIISMNGVSNIEIGNFTVRSGVLHKVNAVIPPANLVTFVSQDASFSTLATGLTAYPSYTYASTLALSTSPPGPFTVFAPTNTAFTSLFTNLGYASITAVPEADLSAILNTHVVAGSNVLSSDLTDGMVVTTLGDTFTINTGTATTFTDLNNRTGNIILTDIQAVNGVIHVIDTVILPQIP